MKVGALLTLSQYKKMGARQHLKPKERKRQDLISMPHSSDLYSIIKTQSKLCHYRLF